MFGQQCFPIGTKEET